MIKHKQFIFSAISSFGFVAFLILVFPLNVSAATLTVNSLNDDVDNDGDCTLREAVVAINDATASGLAVGECIAGDGNDDTIELPAGTVTLSSNTADINEPVIIEGQGIGVSTISGGGSYRIGQAQNDLTLSNLTIAGFLNEAIFSNQGDLALSGVEIDGTSSATSGIGLFGFQMQRLDGQVSTLTLSDVYIHDISANADTGAVGGLLTGVAQDSTINVEMDRVTIANISNTSNSGTNASALIAVTGVIDGTFSPGVINLTADNLTINDVSAVSSAAGAIGGIAAVNGGDASLSLNIRNSTFSGFRGLVNPAFGNTPTSAVGLIGAALQADDGASVSAEFTNTILTDSVNTQTDVSSLCDLRDVSTGFGGAGSANLTITSSGGNLTDDNTCSTYFTEPTDQNNISGLSSTLAPFSDNGGYVPTMALLAGSPAIDAGIDIMGLTTDARGVSRPQLTAYDSGAYEITQAELDAQATPDEDRDTNNQDSEETLAETGFDVAGVIVLSAALLSFGLIAIRKFQKA